MGRLSFFWSDICIKLNHTLFQVKTVEVVKSAMINIAEIILCRLQHVPWIESNFQRLVSWLDLREACVWCQNPRCNVVLTALKCLLHYPESEHYMHPCSQLEQLLFLKQYVVIPSGTLLVNLTALQNPDAVLTLYHMVKQKHAVSDNPEISQCSQMLSEVLKRYSNTSFKVPLKSLGRNKLLPAVRRTGVTTNTSNIDSYNWTDNEKKKQGNNQVNRFLKTLNFACKNNNHECRLVKITILQGFFYSIFTESIIPNPLAKTVFT